VGPQGKVTGAIGGAADRRQAAGDAAIRRFPPVPGAGLPPPAGLIRDPCRTP
jgi:hypothetical protein